MEFNRKNEIEKSRNALSEVGNNDSNERFAAEYVTQPLS